MLDMLIEALRAARDTMTSERGELVLAGGDMCASRFCGDVALPGLELCAGCLADVQAERARVDLLAREATAEHERRVVDVEEGVAA